MSKQSPPEYLWLLVVSDGPGAEPRRHYLDEGPHVVGSGRDADVHIASRWVSRAHARLDVCRDGTLAVEDLGSRNGTKIDGRAVGRAEVRTPCLLSLGSVKAEVRPLDAASGNVALRLRVAGGAPVTQPRPRPERSTEEHLMVERPLRVLAETLAPALQGSGSRTEAAIAACMCLASELPARRIELVRRVDGCEAVIVAAGESLDGAPAVFERAAASGLALRAWGDGRRLRPFEPLLELAVHALDRDESVRTGPDVAPRAPMQTRSQMPPPGSLNPEMAEVYGRAARLAAGTLGVLILGESGTGKELLARFVHAHSPRRSGPFVALNCAALPRDLLEAELFGIERGVATGVDARRGFIEQASGGTLFLDEVGDMAPETQAKLLRMLDSRQFFRVGGRAVVSADIRVLAATNQPLRERIDAGTFRLDLYHRLAGDVLRLPALRERREDIPLLAAFFLHRELRRAGKHSPGLTHAALAALVTHDWPGNVRQLEHEMAKVALVVDDGEPVDVPHLASQIRESGGSSGAIVPLLEDAVREAEERTIRLAVAIAGGDVAVAAGLLGVSRATLYRKIPW